MQRRRPARLAVPGTAIMLAGTAVTIAGPAQATDNRRPKPTIVLVHGALADSNGWNDVTERLIRDGFPVIAAANPLRGVAANGDLGANWTHHLQQEPQRTHTSHYQQQYDVAA